MPITLTKKEEAIKNLLWSTQDIRIDKTTTKKLKYKDKLLIALREEKLITLKIKLEISNKLLTYWVDKYTSPMGNGMLTLNKLANKFREHKIGYSYTGDWDILE
jgi:hypothetical protein